MGQFYFSFFLILQILMLYRWMSKRGIAVIEPAKLFLTSFAIALLLLVSHSVIRLHGGDYYSTFTLNTFIFISISFSFFTLGAISGTIRSETYSREVVNPYYRRNIFITLVLAFGSIVYIVLSIYELYASPISIFRGASIFLLRQIANARDLDIEVGASELVLSLSRTSLLLFLMIVVFQSGRVGKVLGVVAIIGATVFILEGLSTGARSALAFGPLFLGLAGALRLYRLRRDRRGRLRGMMLRSPVRWHYVAIGTVLAYVLFVAFPLSRNPSLATNLDTFLAVAHPSEFGSWVETASQVDYLAWVKVFAYGSSYLTIGVAKLSYFIENTDLPSLHAFGYYNGKVLVRLASIIDPHLYERWLEIRETVAAVLAKDGLTGNPWRTVMGDLLLDFGIIGTPLFLFVMGYAVQWWFRCLVSRQDAAAMTLAGILCAITIVSGFFGPFANNHLAYPLVLITSLLLFWAFIEKAIKGFAMPYVGEASH